MCEASGFMTILPPERSAGHVLAERGTSGNGQPCTERAQRDRFPMRYRWKHIKAQLEILASGQGNPYDGVSLEYVNPIIGGPALPTVGCWIQMLRPGEKTKKHRHTSSAVYFVVE